MYAVSILMLFIWSHIKIAVSMVHWTALCHCVFNVVEGGTLEDVVDYTTLNDYT